MRGMLGGDAVDGVFGYEGGEELHSGLVVGVRIKVATKEDGGAVGFIRVREGSLQSSQSNDKLTLPPRCGEVHTYVGGGSKARDG